MHNHLTPPHPAQRQPEPDQSPARFALRTLFARMRPRGLIWLAIPAAVLVSFIASSTVNIPKIELSADPLYAATGGDKPALVLALSVEFPTVGAQYVSSPGASSDASYSTSNEYLGYYDAESCYTYNDTPTESVATGMTATDYKRFDRSGPAIALATQDPTNQFKTSRKCANAFSGNFLNWASSSAVDMLRLALSGGDRYIDTTGLTVLQRAVIPNGDPICMWNSSNFPAKQVQKDGGGSGQYWGAVPTAMVTAANGSDIWVANTLNRIYFGTSSGGGCGSTGSYTLGSQTTSSGNSIGPIATVKGSLPSNTYQCLAVAYGNCSFSGTKEVWYGEGSKWKVAPASNGVNCSSDCNAVFGDPSPNKAKAVYYVTDTYTGSWVPPATTSGSGSLNSDGFFYARVQVCNVDGSGNLLDTRDYGFCQAYPSGKYKPGGAIQKYSDQVRLAAFSYALDQTASYNSGRYGGVLRAPMKYVGAKTFDEQGNDNTPVGGNAGIEWNTTTGVFNANPDNDTTQAAPISGVINYLNKFGRTGAVAGRYKKYDPVGELHYEALRYLQGLQPSTDAVSNLTTDMYDGFPLFTTWADPYGGTRAKTSDYSCVKSNIVVIGDINTHDGNRLPAASAANNIPDINYWRGVVQNFEKNTVASYLDGQNVSRPTGNPNGANGSVPTATTGSQIMGSAYWAHTHDIRGADWSASAPKQRPGLRVKTFTFDVNEYGAQNNSNTRQYANQLFMGSKYGGFEADASNSSGNPYNTKGNPFQKDDGTNSNDVWQHLDAPGEAGTYYLQSGARGVLSAFDNIFSRASSSARSIAGTAITSKNLTQQVGNMIYQAAFDTSNWSGDVLAIPVAVATSGISVGASIWSGAAVLKARTSPATTRNIVVGSSGATANPAAVPFTWANISAALQTSLNSPAAAATADGLGQRRLNYIRGDQTDDGSTFRARTQLLGDIINSGIVFSGAPSLKTTGLGYPAFATANAARTTAVFVGANDGMLHAFDASNGVELFGYIPSWIAPNLSLLTSKTYAANHRSFVDAPPAIGDADLGPSGTPDWRTVLVSGTGNGGKGVFALDVTDPANFSASKVMWEFTNLDDADMGYVIGRPQILKLRTSASNVSPPTYKSFAVVGSGVNNYFAGTSGASSSTGNPALFLLDLSKPVGSAWVANSNYYKISIPVDSTLSAANATGLINFSAELGTSSEVVRAYMGDLHGKMWRLDFRTAGVSDWTMDKLSAFSTSYDITTKLPTGSAVPLFFARDASNKIQPISTSPSLVYGGAKNVNYVAFGTGKYLEVLDKSSLAQQSFYVLYDDIQTTAQTYDTSSATSSLVSSRTRLRVGVPDATQNTVTTPSFKWGRRTDALVTASSNVYSGWYFDFPTSGERDVSNAMVNGNSLQFSTLYPANSSTGTCGGAGGGGNEYLVNIDTGNGTYRRSTVGILGELLVVETGSLEKNQNASALSPSDSTGRRIRTTSFTSIQTGASGLTSSVASSESIVIGRLSWRRINNYQDLKN